MSSEKSKSETSSSSDIEWTPENEIKLFYSLRGHKPVGVSKNFHMIAILDEFSKLTEKDVSSKTIWDRLEKLYDMDTLHENENLPFPTNSVPFTIEGIKEFEELIAKTKSGTESVKTNKSSDSLEETEVSANQTKSATKAKVLEPNKTNAKVKTETEKSSKKEETKTSEKTDDNEEKGNRLKKQTTKTNAELRSSQTASTKKRK